MTTDITMLADREDDRLRRMADADYYNRIIRRCPQCRGMRYLWTGAQCPACKGEGQVTAAQIDDWLGSVQEGREADEPQRGNDE